MQKTIKVKFPDGEREVPAYEKRMELQPLVGKSTGKVVLTPCMMDGWIFLHTMDGKWIAYEDRW